MRADLDLRFSAFDPFQPSRRSAAFILPVRRITEISVFKVYFCIVSSMLPRQNFGLRHQHGLTAGLDPQPPSPMSATAVCPEPTSPCKSLSNRWSPAMVFQHGFNGGLLAYP